MFTQIDEEILHTINQGLSNPILDVVLVTLTVIGRCCCLVLLSVPFWFGKRKRVALCFAIMIAATDLFVLGLKFAIGRPRPTDVILPLPQSGFPSFPSGHAACAFAGASFLYFSLREGKYSPYFLGASLFTAASLIAFSRLYLGKHYPSDVIAGAFVGFLIGLASAHLLTKKRF